MKKMIYYVLPIVMFILMFSVALNARAEGIITIDNFDYIAYADNYPDVKQAFGYNQSALYQHYVKFGRNEGRVAKTLSSVPSYLSLFNAKGQQGYYFDYVRYANDYPDVKDAVGNNKAALWNHFKTYGYAEGRIAYATNNSINARIRAHQVLSGFIQDGMTDRERVIAVHDWIVNNTAYDYDNYLNSTIPRDSYHMEGVLLHGRAVCAGYAETFYYCMSILGIPSDVLAGMAYTSSGSGYHAWNQVYVDGQWLYVDCTFDDPVCPGYDMLRYDYLLISAEQMGRDHANGIKYNPFW